MGRALARERRDEGAEAVLKRLLRFFGDAIAEDVDGDFLVLQRSAIAVAEQAGAQLLDELGIRVDLSRLGPLR